MAVLDWSAPEPWTGACLIEQGDFQPVPDGLTDRPYRPALASASTRQAQPALLMLVRTATDLLMF